MDMTFEEFLTEQENSFDGEVATTSGFEASASFVWDPYAIALTMACEDDYADILSLPCELRAPDLLVLDTSASDEDDEVLEENLDYFIRAIAGFVPESEYARLFEGVA